jgi:hypothetical protein
MRAITKYLVLALVSAGFLVSAPARSRAGTITYMETVDASGSLGSSTFSNALVTLTFVGDTANITNPSAGIFRNSPGTATVMVNGMTAALSAAQGLDVFVNQTDGTAGIETSATILTVQNSALNNYDLTGSIGPVTGTAGGSTNTPFGTSAGDLVITSFTSQATFQAIVSASVPEPAGLLLMGLGIAGMAATRLRPMAGRSKSAA